MKWKSRGIIRSDGSHRTCFFCTANNVSDTNIVWLKEVWILRKWPRKSTHLLEFNNWWRWGSSSVS